MLVTKIPLTPIFASIFVSNSYEQENFIAKRTIVVLYMIRVNPPDEIKGSNPSPGAYFEEPNTSLKALAGESRVETTNMDGPTANKTIQTR